jgi:hypothetical protein
MPGLDDRRRLEEHALQRARLTGMLLHGGDWRDRVAPGPGGRLLVGLIAALLVCAMVAGGVWVAGQLGDRPGVSSAARSG